MSFVDNNPPPSRAPDRMRVVRKISLVFILSGFLGSATLFGQGIRVSETYLGKSYSVGSSNLKTVVDYFLTCPYFHISDGFSFAYETVDKEEIDLRKEALRGNNEQFQIIVFDPENDYISVRMDPDWGEESLVFTFFDCADGRKIPAFTYSGDTPVGTVYKHGFYEVERNGQWDEADEVFSELTFEDLGLRLPSSEVDHNDWINWELELPRVGGELIARPHSLGEDDGMEPGPEYSSYMGRFHLIESKSARFKWNYRMGKFDLVSID